MFKLTHFIQTTLSSIMAVLLLGTGNAAAQSPINGTWYNSYCSRVDLSINETTGEISGVYTSHTGSTGASNVVGYVDPKAVSQPGVPTNPDGIPVSLGIQWRLINVDASEADGSWHWVSTFSGQYHQKQVVAQPGQANYQIEETLEILNNLIATATVPGFNNVAPVLWPQTLLFHREAPSYCNPVTPPQPVPYTATASDHITGTWENLGGEKLDLAATLSTGKITGVYYDVNDQAYFISGLFDTIAPGAPISDVAEQGLSLTLYDPTENKVRVMAGGVDLSLLVEMNLWESDLSSTTWTRRFTESTLDKKTWFKVAN